MRGKYRFLTSPILILSLIMVMTASMGSVTANPTTLNVDPPSIIDTGLVSGSNFTININVNDVTDLAGFEFFLNYTTAVLSATEITLGPFFPNDSVILHEETNDTLGYVRYVVNVPSGSLGINGSGTLATINFTVESTGETSLDLCLTEMLDSSENVIAHEVYDGYFSNVAVHDVAVINVRPEPTEVPVGESLTINVTIGNQGDLSETFNVTIYYDTTSIETRTGITLESGKNTTLTFTWNTTLVSPGNYTITAEASEVPGETDLEDNTLQSDQIVTVTPPTISATIDVDPDALNLKSKGRWVTCYIEVSDGCNVSDIDRTTVVLNGTVSVDTFWVDKPLESVIGDYDNDAIPDLMVKFDRQALIEFLKTKGVTDAEATLAITGEANGISFEVTDTIKVIGH